jgi:hypothetical protein
MKNSATREFKKAPPGAQTFMLNKQHAYEMVSQKVIKFNEDITAFYKGSPKPEQDKIDKEILPYLY